jgi:oxidoreductase domain protein
MIRWGILGCGVIARRMAAVLQKEEEAVLAAVAARDAGRAAAFAAECGAGKAYGSYAELAADAAIDAVYVATIHPTHAAAVELALRAGKAVLCEKPLTMSSEEARRLFELAGSCGAPLVEAMWTRFLPAWQKAKELADAGAIGEIRGMEAEFCHCTPYDPASRLYDPAQGGGALWDVGIYVCHAAIHILGRAYTQLLASGRFAPSGVDSYAALTLRTPSGAIARLACGSDQCGGNLARINGTRGFLELPNMFGATELRTHIEAKPDEAFSFPQEDGFAYEVRAFHRQLKENRLFSPVVPPEDTVAALQMLEKALSALTL